MDLLERTKTLVEVANSRNGLGMSQRQIADESGVKRDWLAKFMQGRIRSPGVAKIQRLHDFLESRFDRNHVA